jgi:hypothetical protein
MSEHNFEAWCAQHDCHPNDCWLVHNPLAAVVPGAITPEQQRQFVEARHLKMQEGTEHAEHSDQA